MRKRTTSRVIFLMAVGINMVLQFQTMMGAPNTKRIQTLCNSSTYNKDRPFGKSLDYVLDDLVQNTAANNCDYKNISPYPIEFAYGHALCNSTLSTADKNACLKNARETVQQVCGYAVGGRVRLVDCYLRYEAYPFTG